MSSPGIVGKQAAIAGAGIGGLAAAAALSPLFDAVTIYEKDRLPPEVRPRRGVAQGEHVHVFLVGGLASLDALFPGILDDFREAGAVAVDVGAIDLFDFNKARPRRPLDLAILCLSRPSYEHVIRARVAALPNVTVEEGIPVGRIAIEDGAATGLRLKGGGRIAEADLVVDATGRGAALADQLREEGYGDTPEILIGIDVCYVSARFRLAERWRGAPAAMCVPVPPDKRYGVILPIEGGECIVSLGGRCGVEPDDDLDGLLSYAEQLACPAIFERLRDATLTSLVRRYRKPMASWRRYDMLARFPDRLAPVGDTIASFNPTWGQGMTVSVRHALALRESLARVGVDGFGFAADYLPAAAAASAEAWTSTALIDLAHPEVTGVRPPDFERLLAFARGLRSVADADPAIHRLQSEVTHMVKPAAVLRDRALTARIAAALQQAG